MFSAKSPALALLLALTPHLLAAGKVRYNADAKALADKLRPLGLTAKADPNGLKQISAQVAAALTEIEKRAVTNGPGTHALLKNAYELFRPDVGPAHRTAAIPAVESMWNEARALGAFDESHQYTGKITKGPDAGKDVVLEYIVPMDLAPHFSKDITNIRLTSPSKARAANTPPGQRELAYQKNLQAIEQEIEGMKKLDKIRKSVPTDAAGLTLAEAEKRWKEEMKEDGDAALDLPTVVLKGMMISTPSKRSGNKWVVEGEVTNLSHHATEVELQCIVIGVTHKGREDYIMLDQKKKLHLREAQHMRVTFETLDYNTYKGRGDVYEDLSKQERGKSRASYRGTIWRVIHAKGIAASFATDDSMLDMLKKDSKRNVDDMAKLYLPDPKDWKKPVTSANSQTK